MLVRDGPGRRGNPSQHPASTQPAPGLHRPAKAGSSLYTGHPTLSSCSTWQLNMPLINKMVKHVKVKVSTGSMGKQKKRSLMVKRSRRSLFLVNPDDPGGLEGRLQHQPVAAQPISRETLGQRTINIQFNKGGVKIITLTRTWVGEAVGHHVTGAGRTLISSVPHGGLSRLLNCSREPCSNMEIANTMSGKKKVAGCKIAHRLIAALQTAHVGGDVGGAERPGAGAEVVSPKFLQPGFISVEFQTKIASHSKKSWDFPSWEC